MDGERLRQFLDACRAVGLATGAPDETRLAPAVSLAIPSAAWAEAAVIARSHGLRWCAMWATPTPAGHDVHCVLESGGYVVLHATVAPGEALPSQAFLYPAADRPERHAHDLTGLALAGAPDTRRWTRHQAWSADEYPLLPDFPPTGRRDGPTPPDVDYPFARARGRGVLEIPVGPVHAGIIEPGHFRFQAVGETVLNLEQRLGYTHKGIEKLAVGKDPTALARLAGRVSGDSTVAYSWAACQALERAVGLELPPRALWLRAIMAERERIANHLGDIGAICNDVGFAFAQYQFTRLRERFLRESEAAFGHRLMMDRIVPGGVAADVDTTLVEAMMRSIADLSNEVAELVLRLEDSESLEDRLMTTGRLAPEQAELLGCVGYVGRASGLAFDVRRHVPYAPYESFEFAVPVYRAGDVAARTRVRAEEIGESLGLLGRLLDSLPDGAIARPFPLPAEPTEGFGAVDGWRGEILCYVRIAAGGRIERFFPRDPSWLTWPALELAVQGNIVPDFPVCNKSVNGSYSGHDL